MASINTLHNILLTTHVHAAELKAAYCKVLEIWIKVLEIFDVTIIINHSDKVKAVSLTHSIIIMIMSWCDLDST